MLELWCRLRCLTRNRTVLKYWRPCSCTKTPVLQCSASGLWSTKNTDFQVSSFDFFVDRLAFITHQTARGPKQIAICTSGPQTSTTSTGSQRKHTQKTLCFYLHLSSQKDAGHAMPCYVSKALTPASFLGTAFPTAVSRMTTSEAKATMILGGLTVCTSSR